ncbi:MAG: 50S ribosomal protein L13 [Alphaproteobacteria bacterium]|nr:50S ribosomal protein L13 [Alphaproteobacteria bacterium]
MRTYSAKPDEMKMKRKWFVVDAEGLIVGRLASFIASRLRGKHDPLYTPHTDCGDSIVVVNAKKVALTGQKRQNKVYYRHSGYPGGIKGTTALEILEGKYPERVLMKAVERMIPRGSLGRRQLGKLHVYAGETHPHQAQEPEFIDVAALNIKNRERKA